MPGAVIKTVSVPNGSTGNSHPAPHTEGALAPTLPGMGSLPATLSCFAVAVELWSESCFPALYSLAPSSNIRCQPCSLSWACFLEWVFPPHAARYRAQHADKEKEPHLREATGREKKEGKTGTRASLHLWLTHYLLRSLN